MGHLIGIVDDEKLVHFGIQSLLAEDNSPYSICGTWLDAQDALADCIVSPPDLLLTDISMPGMDGLELIRKLKQECISTKVVVLSCHDDYDLVHQAFLLGAEDYLLKKDIDKKRLFEILARVLPDHRSPRKIEAGEPEDFDSYIIETPVTSGVLGIMGFKKEYDTEGFELRWQPDTSMVLQVIRDVLSASDCCLPDRDGRIVICLSPPDQSLAMGTTDPRLERIRSSVSRYLNRKVYISQVVFTDEKDLRNAYSDALEILDGMFYIPESSVLIDAHREVVAPGRFVLPMGLSNKEETWKSVLGEFSSFVRDTQPDPASVKTECIFGVKHLLYHLKEYGAAEPSELIPEKARSYPSILNGFNDFRCLYDWLNQFLSSLYQSIDDKRRENGPLTEIRSYISESLAEDLRLSLVADKFGMNPNYLSAIFKKDTGLSYIEYVNRKRIHLAKELLESTDLSAKEISYRCGYQNPNYFSRVFKSIAGCTISEYRGCAHCNL